MKIWLLTSELSGELAGGIARYISNYAAALVRDGHSVTIIGRTEKQNVPATMDGARLIPVRPRNHLLEQPETSPEPDSHPAYPYNVMDFWPALSFQMCEVVQKLLATESPPDIIESQEYGGLPYYLLQAKLTERGPLETIPILVHLHGPWYELARVNQAPRYRFPNYWMGQMEKFCILAADGLLAPSHYLAGQIRQGFPDRSLEISVVPLPLAASPRQPVVDHPQPKEVLFVGRLELRKGVLALIKACIPLWQAGADFRLSLIGSDTDHYPRTMTVGDYIHQQYQPWIQSGRLVVRGSQDSQTTQQAMRSAWVVVVPSLWENFPNVCMEAMALGQVVLGSRTGGQAEMIGEGDEAGFLFDWSIAGDFEQKLQAVLGISPDAHRTIGARAQSRIHALCDPQAVIPQRIAHYAQMRAQHRHRSEFPTVTRRPLPARTVSTGADGTAGILSIVVPFYNLGRYIEATIASLLASTYRPLEIVIVDDGSTDRDSLSVLEQIVRQYPNVRCEHTTNKGLAAARNTGAQLARGEFLFFMDADDLVEPDFFERAVPVLQHYTNVGFVYSWTRYFDGNTGCWPTWNTELPYLLGHNMVTVMAVVRRSDWLAYGQNKPLLEYSIEDYESWISMVSSGFAGVSLPSMLVRYRVRQDSMYRQTHPDQLLYLYELITQSHPELYHHYGTEMFHLLNANGPSYAWSHPAIAAPEAPAVRLAELESQRNRLSKEVQTLGRAWETHVTHIRNQADYSRALETQIADLMAVLQQRESEIVDDQGITASDYRVGGRLVRTVRRSWVGRLLLGSTVIKRELKKLLRLR